MKILTVALLACISGCASRYVDKPFTQLFDGSAEGDRIVVEGRIDTSVPNFYSLQSSNDRSEGRNCVALILTKHGRERAKAANGKLVEVRGRPIGMGDLNEILPNYSGEINGRGWFGTKCDGQFALYVDAMRVLQQP